MGLFNMNKEKNVSNEKIKENLSLHRLNKTLLWNALFLTTGGTIGLFVKIINEAQPNIIEAALIFIGGFIISILFKLQQELNKEIFKLLDQLDKE